MQRMLMVLLVDAWLRREFPDAVPVPLQGSPGPQAQSGVYVKRRARVGIMRSANKRIR
jgi:hypothetical protein